MRNYEDIQNHKRYQLKHHTPMSLEDAIDALNQAFQKLLEHEEERPLVTVTYFQSDAKKDGGRYMTYAGNFRFYDAEKRVMKFVGGMVIGMGQVCRIEMK